MALIDKFRVRIYYKDDPAVEFLNSGNVNKSSSPQSYNFAVPNNSGGVGTMRNAVIIVEALNSGGSVIESITRDIVIKNK